MEGTVRAVCISEKRGTEKEDVKTAVFIENYGIEGDAHAGDWHRQVSLLSYDKVEEFNRKGGNAAPGAFGENLLVEGIDFRRLPAGTLFHCGEAVLKLTQIGKECHSHCDIFNRVGDCIMPREGVFARVIKGGVISCGDTMTVEFPAGDAPFTAAVITLSDKGSRGERVDTSGPRAVSMLEAAGYEIIETLILPDEQALIQKELIRLSDRRQVNLIVTTGGTGFSERDCTPEATLAVATRNAPGIAEAIRYESMKITPRAMLGRGASVIRNRTLIVNLPGSEKAVAESLQAVIPSITHGIGILTGTEKECGRKP